MIWVFRSVSVKQFQEESINGRLLGRIGKKQMHQLGIAVHLLFIALFLSGAGPPELKKYYAVNWYIRQTHRTFHSPARGVVERK